MALVAIVGRPNVGKSTLFNRLVGMRQAIVDETAGVTRDRHYGKCEWCGTEFSVVDTGGYTSNSDDVFEEAIRRQVVIAVDEADVVLFMVEAATGITDYDSEIADLLRRSKKPVILCVNKVDSGEKMYDAYDFYSLGLGEIWTISAANGSGTGDLLDELVRVLPKGTTRDSISTYYNKFGHEFMLVDTAGIRRKNRVHEDLEFYSVMRSIRAIEHSDVCVLMIDSNLGMEAQDMNIFNIIQKNRKGCVIVVNKWDLFEKESNTMKRYIESLKERLSPFDDVPIVFTSVTEKQRILTVLDEVAHVADNMTKKIPTSALNDVMLEEIENYPPPAWKGKYIKIKYLTQLPTRTPQFAFFCNLPQWVKDPYKRFLENRLREHFDFTGCPIQIYMRAK